MASSLNRCQFIGNLGGDPEVRYLPSGDALCNFTIACTEKWRDKQTGEDKEATEWIRISAFGKLAEICGEYLKKGAKVFCEGKFKTRKYQAQDGTDRYTTEIKLENMIMLGGRPQGDGGEDSGSGYSRERNTNAGNGQQRQQQNRSSAPPSGQRAGSAGRAPAGGGFDEMDDDIPF